RPFAVVAETAHSPDLLPNVTLAEAIPSSPVVPAPTMVPFVALHVTVAPRTAFPVLSVTRTTSGSATALSGVPLWPSPDTIETAPGGTAIAWSTNAASRTPPLTEAETVSPPGSDESTYLTDASPLESVLDVGALRAPSRAVWSHVTFAPVTGLPNLST